MARNPFLQSMRSDRLDRIDRIGSIGSYRLQKWSPGQILSCLDLNFVQIGPKMVDFCHFWFKSDQKWQKMEGFGIFRGQKIRIIFAKIFVIFSRFRKCHFSELSENFEKMTYYSKFGNSKIFVPTRKPNRKFG